MVNSYLNEVYPQIQHYVAVELLSWATLVQVLVIAGAFWLAREGIRSLRGWRDKLAAEVPAGSRTGDDLEAIAGFLGVVQPFGAALLIWTTSSLAKHFHWPQEILYIAGIFFYSLTLVRLFTGQMKNRFWAGILQGFIWSVAALHVLQGIEYWYAILDHVDFSVGQFHITLLVVYWAIFLSLLLYWLARKLTIIWHCWLTMGSGLGPALRILLYKLGSLLLYSAALALVLHYMGLDLTLFTLFSGALGLGLGFGLQKVFANLVSGFIILADKSIKPGDVIQIGSQYGWINYLGSRYVSVVTRNGTEHLVPNENLITNEVINWSYSNKLIRLSVPVGVAYESDLEKAQELMLEVAQATPRVLVDPKPSCLLMGFGDSTINLELRVWINDPQNGISRVKSDLNWGIWKAFREQGIDLPFPQRDIHVKNVVEVKDQGQAEKFSK